MVPVRMWWKKVRLALWLSGLVLLAAGGLLLGTALYQAVTPDIYDAYGQVVYSMSSAGPLQTPCPGDVAFQLPDGTVPQLS